MAKEKDATTSDELAEVVRRLVSAYAPEQIYLFGSAARGDDTRDSDYDLLIVVPDGTPEALRSSRRAYEALWGLRVAVDALVWTRSAFQERLHLKASLPATVVREGRLLHVA